VSVPKSDGRNLRLVHQDHHRRDWVSQWGHALGHPQRRSRVCPVSFLRLHDPIHGHETNPGRTVAACIPQRPPVWRLARAGSNVAHASPAPVPVNQLAQRRRQAPSESTRYSVVGRRTMSFCQSAVRPPWYGAPEYFATTPSNLSSARSPTSPSPRLPRSERHDRLSLRGENPGEDRPPLAERTPAEVFPLQREDVEDEDSDRRPDRRAQAASKSLWPRSSRTTTSPSSTTFALAATRAPRPPRAAPPGRAPPRRRRPSLPKRTRQPSSLGSYSHPGLTGSCPALPPPGRSHVVGAGLG